MRFTDKGWAEVSTSSHVVITQVNKGIYFFNFY